MCEENRNTHQNNIKKKKNSLEVALQPTLFPVLPFFVRVKCFPYLLYSRVQHRKVVNVTAYPQEVCIHPHAHPHLRPYTQKKTHNDLEYRDSNFVQNSYFYTNAKNSRLNCHFWITLAELVLSDATRG